MDGKITDMWLLIRETVGHKKVKKGNTYGQRRGRRGGVKETEEVLLL